MFLLYYYCLREWIPNGSLGNTISPRARSARDGESLEENLGRMPGDAPGAVENLLPA
jgi:hypothetical protein